MDKMLKSFIYGVGQAIDLGSTAVSRHEYVGYAADRRAMHSDMVRIGGDMRKAATKISKNKAILR